MVHRNKKGESIFSRKLLFSHNKNRISRNVNFIFKLQFLPGLSCLGIRRWKFFFRGDRGESSLGRGLEIGTRFYLRPCKNFVPENFIKITFLNYF
jgi:hypothetical protein